LLISGLAACGPGDLFEDSSVKATREAQDALYQQTLVFVETQAATIIALQATADSAAAMSTQIVQLGAQNRSMQGTIDAAFAGIFPQQTLIPQPAAPQPGQTLQPNLGSTPLFPENNPATPTAQTATFVQATTTTAVNDDDGCAEDSVSTFEATEDQIYMVTVARNVQPGTTFSTRWAAQGQASFETVSWTPNEFFEEICIWFFIQPSDLDFQLGNWTVELVVNGLAAISRTFQIGNATQQQQQPSNVALTPTPG
jgi:hypothetical protein